MKLFNLLGCYFAPVIAAGIVGAGIGDTQNKIIIGAIIGSIIGLAFGITVSKLIEHGQ